MALAQARVDFHSDPLTFDLAQIFTKKRSKSAKSSPIFHLKGRRDTSWLYNFWIAQWVNFFLENYFVLNLAIFFRGKKGSKLDQKRKLWESPVYVKFGFFENSQCTVFVSLNTTCGKNFTRICQYLGELGPRTSPKGAFHGCWIGTKNFENL